MSLLIIDPDLCVGIMHEYQVETYSTYFVHQVAHTPLAESNYMSSVSPYKRGQSAKEIC